MRLACVLLLAWPLVIATGGALAAQGPATTARLALQVSGMDDVRVQRDVVYRVVGSDSLRFDVYLPQTSAGLVPAVILFSGSNDARSWAGYGDLGRVVAVHGLAAVHPAKRYGRGQIAAGASDIEELLSVLRRDGPKLGNFYGGSDLWVMLASMPDSVRQAMAPLSGVDLVERHGARIPPLLVARAGRDRPQLNAEIDTLAAAARRKSLRFELINYAGGQYGFDVFDHTDESRAIIRRALGFARQHLGVG